MIYRGLVIKHFRENIPCRHCGLNFEEEGITFLREEKDYVVVSVTCTYCDTPAGVALVGVETEVPDDEAA